MQWAKLTADEEFAGRPLCGEPLEPVAAGPPLLHAAASRARAAVAIMTAAIRAVAGHARRDGRMTRVLSFIVPSSGLGRGRARARRRGFSTLRDWAMTPAGQCFLGRCNRGRRHM
jgi:hypothetical protein